jgi:hypothetical protein
MCAWYQPAQSVWFLLPLLQFRTERRYRFRLCIPPCSVHGLPRSAGLRHVRVGHPAGLGSAGSGTESRACGRRTHVWHAALRKTKDRHGDSVDLHAFRPAHGGTDFRILRCRRPEPTAHPSHQRSRRPRLFPGVERALNRRTERRVRYRPASTLGISPGSGLRHLELRALQHRSVSLGHAELRALTIDPARVDSQIRPGRDWLEPAAFVPPGAPREGPHASAPAFSGGRSARRERAPPLPARWRCGALTLPAWGRAWVAPTGRSGWTMPRPQASRRSPPGRGPPTLSPSASERSGAGPAGAARRGARRPERGARARRGFGTACT